jgi:hypothetical protein
MKKIALPLALSSLLFAALGWAVQATGPSPEPSEPFSRSRWKAQQEAAWGARFEGDVKPGGRARVRTPFDLKTVTGAPARAAAPGTVRVSFDVLEPNGGPAQPETQAEPYLALNPEKETHLLAGYQESRFSDGGARALGYAVSFDTGKTWQEGLIPGLSAATGGPYERISDPWVAFGPGGRAYFCSLAFNESRPENGIFVSISEDGGRTWGEPVAVHTAGLDFDDKQAIVVDTRTDSPFRGRVYVGWDTATGTGRQPMRFSYSADSGLSYRPPVTIYDGGAANIGIIPMVGPGGVVHAVWTRFPRFRGEIVAARSTDGGDTWSEPVVIADIRTAGVADARTGGILPTAAIDPKRGDLYVAWQDSRFSPGVDQIVLSRSSDGGQTWSAPQRVSDGPLDAPNFTPALAVNPNGLVGVSYYSLRHDPERRFLVDEYFTLSRNRGQRFLSGQRVSAASWDLRFAAFAEGFFLGDYQGLVAGKKTFHPLWIATLSPSRIDAPALQPDAFTRALKAK